MVRVSFLVAAFSISTAASAWDTNTHKVIGVIAYRHLTPQAKAWCDRMLSLNQRGYRNFLNAAPYPDYLKHGSPRKDVKKMRRFDGWHYINYPVMRNQGLAFPKDTSVEADGDNVLFGIAASVQNVQSGLEGTRGLYLAMILHLVGDAHQPMHCAERDADKGGNDFALRGTLRNLHSLWDGAITTKYRLKGREKATDVRIERVARDVETNYPLQAMEAEAEVIDPRVWATESYALAVDSAYDGITPGTFPSAAYKSRWTAVAERRVALAGYRLAGFLNRLAMDSLAN